MSARNQLSSQLSLALLALFVVLPLLWMARLGLDATITGRPADFALLPRELTFANLQRAWEEPRADISFLALLRNSLVVAGGTALLATAAGTLAAYAFARMRFPGHRAGLFASLVLLTMPPAGLAAPYFIYLSSLQIRQTHLGLIMVYTAVAMPFAIWTVRNAVQTISRDLEEAAMLEGAGRWTIFQRIVLPLALPSVAVAGFIGFLIAWSEFAFGWAMLSNPRMVTLAMALDSMRDSSNVSWGLLSATAMLVCLPVVAIFYLLGERVIDGLSLGAASERR